MDNGWPASARAWIDDQGEHGDFGRRHVLDAVMLPRALAHAPRTVLDVGCGEGRFCRALQAHGVEAVGIDPTSELLTTARARDISGVYLEAIAEHLPFGDASFDLVVSYLSLIDIPDITLAIPEMARVLKPGGILLIANLNAFITACADDGWVKDEQGRRLHYRVDNYLGEHALWLEWRGIRILNHHRPMSTYFRLLLNAGLRLTHFDEPMPTSDTPLHRQESYRRVPWFLVMEWLKPASAL